MYIERFGLDGYHKYLMLIMMLTDPQTDFGTAGKYFGLAVFHIIFQFPFFFSRHLSISSIDKRLSEHQHHQGELDLYIPVMISLYMLYSRTLAGHALIPSIIKHHEILIVDVYCLKDIYCFTVCFVA